MKECIFKWERELNLMQLKDAKINIRLPPHQEWSKNAETKEIIWNNFLVLRTNSGSIPSILVCQRKTNWKHYVISTAVSWKISGVFTYFASFKIIFGANWLIDLPCVGFLVFREDLFGFYNFLCAFCVNYLSISIFSKEANL